MSNRSDLRLDDLSDREVKKILKTETKTKNIDDFKNEAYKLYKIDENFEEKKKKMGARLDGPRVEYKVKERDVREMDEQVRKIRSSKGKSIHYYYMQKYEQIKIDKTVYD